MNENLWSILAEFTHPRASESFEQVFSAMKMVLDHLNLPEMFLQRLNISLIETITNHIHRLDEDQAASTVKIRILSNCANPQTSASSTGWGFFCIENDHLIELYLYQDHI